VGPVPSLGIDPTLVGEEGAAAEEGVVQQVVQQGGHRWVVVRMVLRAEVLDGEDGVGRDARPLQHLRANLQAQLVQLPSTNGPSEGLIGMVAEPE
jgi:hypothetical protein